MAYARLSAGNLWWKWGWAQWVVFIGCGPGIALVHAGSITSPLANILAIPWVSLLVVPAAMLGALLQLLFDWPWLVQWAARLLNWLFSALEWLAFIRQAERLAYPGWVGFLLGLVGVTALLSPMARLLALPAAACVLALFLPPQPRPEPRRLGDRADVGQGCRCWCRPIRDLLYDTGLLASGFDLGEAVVHPALLALGAQLICCCSVMRTNDRRWRARFIADVCPWRGSC